MRSNCSGEREGGTGKLAEAASAYREALLEQTRERLPLERAAAQVTLGAALYRLGEREGGTGKLVESVFAFREALQKNTRVRDPHKWAMTKNNRGLALALLESGKAGRRGSRRLCAVPPSRCPIEEAVAAFRAALQEFTHARVPPRWAATQMCLGKALMLLGEREVGTARLEEAAAAFHESLKERTRERAPVKWAMLQENLASVYRALFDKTREPRYLDDALAAIEGALEEFCKAKAANLIAKARQLREKLLAAKGEL